LHRLLRDRAGNTLAMIAAALLPLLAMVGGGIDMGRSYLAQTRLQQACDAGVLATRKALGTGVAVDGDIPDAAATTGNSFFNLNFRDGAYGSTDRTFEMAVEDDLAISGSASVNVPTSIMGIFGFAEVPLTVECSAQVSMSNIDLMLVLDVTGSMMQSNPGDSAPRIDVMKDVIRDFHAEMEANKGPASRVRYGFVPYSTNVNVGGLLEDDWVVDQWTYQSRTLVGTGTASGTYSFYTARSPVSGSRVDTVASTYPANGGGNCNGAPRNTSITVNTPLGTTSQPFVGPPAGTQTITNYRSTVNGDEYVVKLRGGVCTVIRSTYTNYIWKFDYITQPALVRTDSWNYGPVLKDVSNWRSESDGCIEERDTYEIGDYANVDLTRALDLDLDLVPTSGDPASQWRPHYPELIYGRQLEWTGRGNFDPAAVTTTREYISPHAMYTDACPAAARKLAAMDAGQLNSYLATIDAKGSTYHDIGMLWGARLISPTGLFASENADVSASDTTSRNMIFMTDGQTSTLDVSYSAYGIEPVDRRRWSPGSGLTLTDTVEARFAFACAEAKKRNVTLWLIAFGTIMNPVFEECAGPGHTFQADNGDELADAFSTIANRVADLRITR
jgi:Flp pilus assembly protein TadG